jgi:hypothetical protein
MGLRLRLGLGLGLQQGYRADELHHGLAHHRLLVVGAPPDQREEFRSHGQRARELLLRQPAGEPMRWRLGYQDAQGAQVKCRCASKVPLKYANQMAPYYPLGYLLENPLLLPLLLPSKMPQ